MSWVTYYVKLVDTKQLSCASCKCTTSVLIFHVLLVIGATNFGGRQRSPLFCFFFFLTLISLGSFPSLLGILHQISSLKILLFWVFILILFPFQPTYLLGNTTLSYLQLVKYNILIFFGKISHWLLLVFTRRFQYMLSSLPGINFSHS